MCNIRLITFKFIENVKFFNQTHCKIFKREKIEQCKNHRKERIENEKKTK